MSRFIPPRDIRDAIFQGLNHPINGIKEMLTGEEIQNTCTGTIVMLNGQVFHLLVSELDDEEIDEVQAQW